MMTKLIFNLGGESCSGGGAKVAEGGMSPCQCFVNASFHNDIKIPTITWDSPNTANIVPFGGDWGGGGGGAELKESLWREYCQCLFHKKITTITWASPNSANNVSFGVLALWRV